MEAYDALQKAVKPPYNLPESAGLTQGALQDTLILPFNDLEGVKEKLKGIEDQVAGIIIEPVLGAGGAIPAEKEFLKGLREFCDQHGILLIFDEVITVFRLAPGGGQQYFGVKPDITVLGKILGGGFPVGAFCGLAEIMERVDHMRYQRPQASFHGGTFTANPITMTAGLTTLKILEDGRLIKELNKLGDKIRAELTDIFEGIGVDVQVTGTGSLFGVHFTKEEVKEPGAAFRADRQRLVEYNLKLIANGVFFLPTHSGCLCTAHTKADIEKLFFETGKFVKSLR